MMISRQQQLVVMVVLVVSVVLVVVVLVVVVQMVMCAAAGLGPAQPRRTGQLPHRRTSTSTSSRVRQCSQHHGAAPPTAEHSTALQHCSTAAACPGHCRG